MDIYGWQPFIYDFNRFLKRYEGDIQILVPNIIPLDIIKFTNIFSSIETCCLCIKHFPSDPDFRQIFKDSGFTITIGFSYHSKINSHDELNNIISLNFHIENKDLSELYKIKFEKLLLEFVYLDLDNVPQLYKAMKRFDKELSDKYNSFNMSRSWNTEEHNRYN